MPKLEELRHVGQSVPSGDGISAGTGMWRFGGSVPATFDTHVRRSVPLYEQGHELVLRISEYFVGPESRSYEIGCSTGSLIRKLADQHKDKRATFVGIDVEDAMIHHAQRTHAEVANLEFTCDDATTYDFEASDFMVAYYTVQFVRPKYRQTLIDRIYQSLNWGGAFVMFEKVRAPDARFQDIAAQIYFDFKSCEGYSAEEIMNKSRSLKRVLEPFSSRANLEMLERAGFKDVMTVMKYVCFEGFLAIK